MRSSLLKFGSDEIQTQKGTKIRRSHLGVGKDIGGSIYLHKMYSDTLPNQQGLQEAIEQLPAGCEYNVIKAAKDGSYTFFNSPDFDTADEPTAGPFVRIAPRNGKTLGQTANIWHHKWLWVKDDYPGFDVEAQLAA